MNCLCSSSFICESSLRLFQRTISPIRSLNTQGQHAFRSLLENEAELKQLRGLPIIHHHGYVCDLPPNHQFPMPKFHKVLDHLLNDRIIEPYQVVKPCPIGREAACSVHTEDYIEKFFKGSTSQTEQRTTGFTWSPGLASRVRYETGGTVLASILSQQRGLAASTAGGTHHAFPDHGSGFCLVNDLAVAAQCLLNWNGANKILIVDLDVHQGDGTAYIFQQTPQVYTFSMHCGHNFPFRKQKSDLDIELEPGADDKQFMNLLIDYLPMILDSFRPDIVLYDAGVDPHRDDVLGKLKLTDEGLLTRDSYVISSSIKRGIPCAAVIGGGYSKDIDSLARRHTIIHRAAAELWRQHGL